MRSPPPAALWLPAQDSKSLGNSRTKHFVPVRRSAHEIQTEEWKCSSQILIFR
jgi:hypothetical protein